MSLNQLTRAITSYRKTAIVAASFAVLYVIRRIRVYQFGQCKRRHYSLDGQVAVITGGCSTIGIEVAKDLATRGACVVLATSNKYLENAAIKEVHAVAPNAQVEARFLDLSSLQSIEEFADDIQHYFGALHILICLHCAESGLEYTETKEGFELCMGEEFLGHFYLLHEFLEVLQSSQPSRVVYVVNPTYIAGYLRADSLFLTSRNFSPFAAHANASLANLLTVREFSNRYHKSGVNIYATCLGELMPIWSKFSILDWLKFSYRLPIVFWSYKTPKQAAQTILECAIGDATSNESGGFYKNCAKVPYEPIANNDKFSADVWEQALQVIASKRGEKDSVSENHLEVKIDV